MRTSEFKFKKTKRIKQVTEHRGITVDLTEQEAADLALILGRTCYAPNGKSEDWFGEELYRKLREFSKTTLASVIGFGVINLHPRG